jgi:hypothetical protein
MNTQIEHRLNVALAQRGNVGKSTFAICLAQWLDHHGVAWRGFDLDNDHQSFSRSLPDAVQAVEIGSEPLGDLLKVFRVVPTVPVAVIDPRAHMSGHLIDSLQITQFPASFAEIKGRVTVILFPADDLETMANLDSIVSSLNDSVDYVVVRNLARTPRTRMLDGSEIESELMRLGAGFVELPTLLSAARNCIAAKEAELGRGVTAIEIVANRELGVDPMIRLVVEDWLRTIFRRFDAVAHLLVPSVPAEKITSSAVGVLQSVKQRSVRGAKLNLKSF